MYALISLQVVIVDILEEVGKKTAEELCSTYGNRVVFFKCNITDKKDREGIHLSLILLFQHLSLNLNVSLIHSQFMCCFSIFQHIYSNSKGDNIIQIKYIESN